MTAPNDDFASATELVLAYTTPVGQDTSYDDTVLYTQTDCSASYDVSVDPFAVKSLQWTGVYGESNSYVNEYQTAYRTSSDATDGQPYMVGSLWFRLRHPVVSTQGGDYCRIGVANALWTGESSWSWITTSVWTGPDTTTDPKTLTQVNADLGTTAFYWPDTGSVWVKVSWADFSSTGSTISSFELWYALDRRSVGDWLDSPTLSGTGGYNDDYGVIYLDGTAAGTNYNSQPVALFGNEYATVNVNFARGFNAGGGHFIGGEPNYEYPQEDPGAYACSFYWGRKLISYEPWVVLRWWTDTGQVDGGFPGSCQACIGDVVAAYGLDPADNVEVMTALGTGGGYWGPSHNTSGQMAAGIIQDAHEGDIVGIGSEKYSSSWYGMPYLQIDWDTVSSFRPNISSSPYYPWPPNTQGYAALGVQFEPGPAVIESITVTPRDMTVNNTQGGSVTCEWWIRYQREDLPIFGVYEKTVAVGPDVGWPAEIRYRSGEPQEFLSAPDAALIGTTVDAGSAPMTVPGGLFADSSLFYPQGNDSVFAQKNQGYLRLLVADTALLYNSNPITSGSWPNIYEHRLLFRADYTVTIRPPRYRYVYPEPIAWLRQNQRDDHLGNIIEARGPNARNQTTASAPPQSEQEGVRTTTRNWKGYR